MDITPGAWPSPITAADAVAAGRSLEAVAFAGDEVWWSEGRPTENGRIVVCRNRYDGSVEDLLPPPWNARNRVHEYGGTSWLPVPGREPRSSPDLVFTHFADQRLYRVSPGDEPQPLTSVPSMPAGLRYADLQLDARRGRLIAVRESHRGNGTFGTVDRTLVAVPLDGSAADDAGQVVDLLAAEQRTDFVAGPRLSGAGDALTWITWNHPDMPWDSTVVHLAGIDHSGRVGPARQIGGGPGVSAIDPGFTPDGSVVLLSDESGWWQPMAVDVRTSARRQLTDEPADFGQPLWVLGRRAWAPVPGGRLLVRRSNCPALLDSVDGGLTTIDPDWTYTSDLATTAQGRIALIVGGDRLSARVVVLESNGDRTVLRRTTDDEPDPRFLPTPESRTVAGVHIVWYPPTHPEHDADPGTAPLLVTVHGGPTSQQARTLSTRTTYFTSRGFAVAAVDYHGSTGYGRPYRDALRGHWADLDITDAMAVAAALVGEGTVGAAVIVGGSAGGLTVLGALTTPGNPFAGGASYFGVADLKALAADTHDFESRYLDGLLGSDPELWTQRSPLTHADRLSTPVLLLQGGQDPIVTPNQAEAFARACVKNQVPHALVIFPEESHGFRAAAALIAAIEAEISFYGHVLGFEPPGVPVLPLQR